MADVFISYSRKDSEIARKLHDNLLKANRETWVDWEGIPLSADWLKEIYAAIEASDTFVFIISPDSLASEVCNLEIAHAMNHNKRMVPILYREASTKEVHKAVAAHNWVMMRPKDDFESSFRDLMKAMDQDLEHCRMHTRILTKALEWEKKGKERSFLLRGIDLGEAELWKESGEGKDPAITEIQKEYIESSRNWAVKKKRITIGSAFAALILLVGISLYSLQEINRGKRLALARDLLIQSKDLYQKDKKLVGLLLTTHAYKLLWNNDKYILPEAEESLREILQKDNHFEKYALNQTVSSVAISSDGKTLVTVNYWKAAKVWDLTNPEKLPVILEGHEDKIHAIAISPDGKTLVTGSGDKTARVWDLTNPEKSSIVLTGHEDEIHSIAISPDGKSLFTGSWDKTVRIWDLSDPKKEPMILRGHKDIILSLAISPDGKKLFTGSRDKTVRIWDLTKTNQNPIILKGHNNSIVSIAISPNGEKLLTGSFGSLGLWDLNNLTEKPIISKGESEGGIQVGIRVAFSPDGSVISLVGGSAGVKISNLSIWDDKPIVLQGNDDEILSFSISSNGKNLVTACRKRLEYGSSEDTVRVWDLSRITDKTKREPNVFSRGVLKLSESLSMNVIGHTNVVMGVAISPDGKTLVTGSQDKTARIWDLTNPENPSISLEGHEDYIWSLAMSPDGKTLVTGSGDKTARVWDLTNLEKPPIVLTGHEGKIETLAISPDGKTLVTGSADTTARIWDLSNPKKEPLILRGHTKEILSLAISSDGERLVTSSNDRTVRIWDLKNLSKEPIAFQGHGDFSILKLAISPDGRILATDGLENTALVFDLKDLKKEPIVLRGHQDMIEVLSISPDGKSLISGSSDNTARIWDLTDLNREPRVIYGHTDYITSLAFSPDGKYFVTGSGDHTARLWLLQPDDLIARACEIAGRNLTKEEWDTYVSAEEPYEKVCPNYP